MRQRVDDQPVRLLHPRRRKRTKAVRHHLRLESARNAARTSQADDGELLSSAFDEGDEVVELAGHRLVGASIRQVRHEDARIDHAQLRDFVIQGERLLPDEMDLRETALQQDEGVGFLRELYSISSGRSRSP